MFKEDRNGHYCMSDVNLVAALTTPTWPIQPDGKVDMNDEQPALELGFVYVHEFEQKRRKDFEGSTQPGFAYYSASLPREHAVVETKPVVMFAVRPLRGTFGLHAKKVSMWHNGRLMVNGPAYAVKHRELLMMVRDYLARYKDRQGAETQASKVGGDLLVVRSDGTMAEVGNGNTGVTND
jgi:hypothetical protein